MAGAIAAGFPGNHLRPDGHERRQDWRRRLRRPGHRRGRPGADGGPQQRADGRRRHRGGHRRTRGETADEQRAARAAGEDRQRVLRAGCLREGDQQRRGRGRAGDASRLPAAAPDGRGEREQARLLREAVRDRFAGRARGHGRAEAGADEEPGARRRVLLALQQHDPGGGRSGQEGRHRQARCALFDVLHESGEAHAARERAPRRHERHRVADSELVQLHLALRRQPRGAGGAQRGQDHVADGRQAADQAPSAWAAGRSRRTAATSTTTSR